MLMSVHPTHRGIIYSLRGCSRRGPKDQFILSAHFTDEKQREEVIGGGVESGIKRLAWVGWKKNLQGTSWCPKSV